MRLGPRALGSLLSLALAGGSACGSSYGETSNPGGGEDAGTATPGSCTGPNALGFAGHCYFTTEEALAQPLAKEACEQQGAHLVTIGSDDEQLVVRGLGSGDRWIGLVSSNPASNDRATYGWVTGEPVTVDSWYPNDPDQGSACVAINANLGGRWVDRPCTEPLAAVCERD